MKPNALLFSRIRLFRVLLVLALLLVFSFLVSLAFGEEALSWQKVKQRDSTDQLILFSLRLPHAVLAAWVGASLAASGCALQAMMSPFVWIVGGQDKGNDYGPLVALVEAKARGIVCLGVDNTKILAAFGHLGIPMIEARSAREAVLLASRMASPGDVALLSPACASFDLFRNYEDRGDQFRAEVKALLQKKKENE